MYQSLNWFAWPAGLSKTQKLFNSLNQPVMMLNSKNKKSSLRLDLENLLKKSLVRWPGRVRTAKIIYPVGCVHLPEPKHPAKNRFQQTLCKVWRSGLQRAIRSFSPDPGLLFFSRKAASPPKSRITHKKLFSRAFADFIAQVPNLLPFLISKLKERI